MLKPRQLFWPPSARASPIRVVCSRYGTFVLAVPAYWTPEAHENGGTGRARTRTSGQGQRRRRRKAEEGDAFERRHEL